MYNLFKKGINKFDEGIKKYNINTILFTIVVILIFYSIKDNYNSFQKKEFVSQQVLEPKTPKFFVPNKCVVFEEPIVHVSKNKKHNKALETFIDKYLYVAKKCAKRYKIPVSVILAQGILESDYGRSELFNKSNNLFGIKKKNEKLTSLEGKLISGYVLHMTSEFVKSEKISEKYYFCKYRSPEDSFRHYCEFISKRRKNMTRYKSLKNLSPRNWKGWTKGLKDAGYSTNPQYDSKLDELISRYKLYKFD